MKPLLLSILLFFFSGTVAAPQNLQDAVQKELDMEDDLSHFKKATSLFEFYAWSYPDSALPYAQQNLRLALKLKSDSLLIAALDQYKVLLGITGNYAEALQYAFEILKIAKRTRDSMQIAIALKSLGDTYRDQGDYKRAVQYGQDTKAIFDRQFSSSLLPLRKNDTLKRYINLLVDLAKSCEKEGLLDSAFRYTRFAEQACEVQYGVMDWAAIPFVYGNVYLKKGDYTRAIQSYHRGLDLAVRIGWNYDIMDNGFGLANTYQKMNRLDSAIFYANKVIEASKSAHYPVALMNALTLLANAYKAKNEIDSSARYFELSLATKESFFSQDKVVQMQSLTFNEQLRQQELQEQQLQEQYRFRTAALLIGVGVLLIVAFLLYRNNRNKQRAKLKIEKAYAELKATQAQLIQREKMASLGELTAGIAHEIQNPLNFVNNFSEVNAEMIEEIEQEVDKGNIVEVKSILNDLKENEQKINLHGKRADAIVKSMLEHSRASKGSKEPTDINALADEYLRLSYHGFRAKDKSFNASIETDFDNSIGKVDIVQQDIGRVLLNLFNNAFYAVQQKKQPLNGSYEPTVSVSTKKLNDTIEMHVKDNGTGIPQKVVDKIFQPFFTTKPTGEGTGLGLSLSYDIMKAHGGEIRVESEEGDGVEFIITLPLY